MKHLIIIFIFCFAKSADCQLVRNPAYASYSGTRNSEGTFVANTVYVADHRWDADIAWNGNTDVYAYNGGDERDWFFAEAAHFKYNLGGTCFERVNVSGGNWTKRQNVKKGGRIQFGYYMDLGAWNEVDTNVLRATIQMDVDSLSAHGNISTISYANGDTTGFYKFKHMQAFLGGRNSQTSTVSFYGYGQFGDTLGSLPGNTSNYNIQYTLSRPSTYRLSESDSVSTASAATSIANYLPAIASSKGFFNHFIHWHGLYNNGVFDYRNMYFGFMKKQRDKLNDLGAFAYSDGYGSIVEYSYGRGLVDSVWLLENIGLTLKINYQANPEIAISLIQTPVSYIITTTGTVLEGQEIQCTGCAGIKKINTDSFLIDVPVPSSLAQSSVDLISTSTPDYYNFTVPTIVSATYSAPNLTITTDIPTRATVFYGPRTGAGPWDLENAIRSGSAYSTTHVLDISSFATSKDVYVGVISEVSQSTLSNVYRF